jgi:hypothetical protein
MSRRVLPLTSLIAVFGAACTPQSAELVSGTYTAFLATSTSASLLKGEVDPEDFDKRWQLDCRQFCPGSDDTPEELCIFESKDEEALLRLPDSILDEQTCLELMAFNSDEEVGGTGEPPFPSTQGGDPYAIESWLLEDGFEVVQEEIEPWRGEAIINSEGDLQIGFHHRLPGGADFRFNFTVNPNFQPITCKDVDGDDVTEPVAVDGDWVSEWSGSITEILERAGDDPRYDPLRQFEGGQLYHINSFSYQFNPDNPQDFDTGFWSLPNEWRAGMSFGKFAEEFISHRTVRYGEPLMYSTFEATEDSYEPVVASENVWYCDLPDGADPTADPTCLNQGTGYEWFTMGQLIERTTAVTRESLDELAFLETVGGPAVGIAPFVEDNTWRRPDGQPPGLDGWTELHYNYVVIDASSDLTVGGTVHGAFQLTMDGVTSTSRILINGEFESERIRADKWTSKNLQAEQGVGRCESAPLLPEE